MIKFNANSIYYRGLEKLQQDPDWKVIANNSVITAVLRSNAEIQAETARYAEYLFKESKWDTAQNPSSILSMAGLLGYQPKRKISARGKIYVSTDPKTHLVGKTISGNAFKALTSTNNALGWNSSPATLQISSTCKIIDSNGISYIASPGELDSGKLYSTINIIQGEQKSIVIDIATIRATATKSKLDPYLYIPIHIKSCEDASNALSKAYFKVYVITSQDNSGSKLSYDEYRVVNSLLLSSKADKDVEVYNDLYNQELFYFKFNNDPLRGSTLDLSQNSSVVGLRVDYVETLGSAGNLTHNFENFVIEGVSSSNGTYVNVKLYGINLDPIIGGKDEETSAEVKINAPKFYINNYTAGTKEAYEKTILNMEFPIGGTPIRPKKVQVYGSTQTTENGLSQPITCISFIADNLEDLVTSNNSTDSTYSKIEESLNYYLSRLKSPQDTLKFVAPTYVPFSLGLNVTLSKDATEDINELTEKIRNFVDEAWGPSSDDLDFGRSFYPSRITHEVLAQFPDDVQACKTEVEAVKKLNWSQAERIEPMSNVENSTTIIHTCRIPFDFSSIFYGNESTKGFRDHRVGADYVMRFDFMYKKPKSMSVSAVYHTSLFIQETDEKRNTDAFYIMSDTTNNTKIWPENLSNNTVYKDLENISKLNKAWQFRYRESVYSDDEFRDLIDESSQAYIPTLKTYLNDPGTIDDYLIYFSAGYDKSKSTIGDGFLEITFEPIYRMLATFALYDSELNTSLQECPIALLKCGNIAEGADVFEKFKSIVADYVDIYVSMRPIDEDLVIESTSSITGNSVLYIDSSDSDSSQTNSSNLTSDKRPRMISIKCKYGE